MADIPVTGVPTSYRAPITAIEIMMAQGASSGVGAARETVFVGPKLSTGTMTAGVLTEVNTEDEIKIGAGAGSGTHRAVREFKRAGGGRCYVLLYAPSSGSGAATAAGAITITGSTATAAGNLYFTVCGEVMSVAFAVGATPTTIGDMVAMCINAKDWLPCTATNTTGTVALVAKMAGESQGTATVGVIRYRASVDAGKGITVATQNAALGMTGGTAGADGATTEAANFTAALALMESDDTYYIVPTSVWNATAQLAFKAHLVNKNLPATGKMCKGIFGYTGAQSAAQAFAITNNYEGVELINQPNSEWDIAALVGNYAAVCQVLYNYSPRFNLDLFSGSSQVLWNVPPVYSQADIPDSNDWNDAVTDGVTLVGSNKLKSYIVMAACTRSKDSTGLIDDFRATEPHRWSVMHWMKAAIVLRWTARFSAKALRADEKLDPARAASLTNVNPNQDIPRDVITPSIVAPMIKDIIDENYADGNIQEAETSKTGLILQIATGNSGRLQGALSIRTIDLAHQFTLRLSEMSPG